MKRLLTILSVIAAIMAVASCGLKDNELPEGPKVVFAPQGPTVLEDAQFGVYYGNKNYDDLGVFYLVLSDARCYKDKSSEPYMDSDGDMLVLELKSELLQDDAEIIVPDGEYKVSSDASAAFTISQGNSFVKRFVKDVQSKWSIESGSISFRRTETGKYEIIADELVIAKTDLRDTVSYECNTYLKIANYLESAAGMITQEDDIIDLPFADVTCDYYGNMYGYGTGNFVITMSTKDLLNDVTGNFPGVLMTLNCFSKLYASSEKNPVLEAGSYKISSITSAELFTRWTLLPGLLMDSSPFGTYIYQQVEDADGLLEFISSGTLEVEYDENDICTLTYDFKTSSRKISGKWRGKLNVENYASDETSEPLSTLDHDVACDMSKVESASLSLIEVLHRANVDADKDYDIAEAWQMYLQPRDWTDEEKDIPYYDDKDGNGVSDRIDAWCGDGDVMVLEFLLPLGSNGDIAPELGQEYVYTMQPNLSVSDPNYEACVSSMGRPDDTVFDPAFKDNYFFMEGYDRCNGRRGFTWAVGGYRGNWYLHYETGRHFIIDGHAPAINGTVKVVRTSETNYEITWDLIDDAPTPNKITGSWSGPVRIYN